MSFCKFCGKEFKEENKHQIFCSDVCRRKQRNLLKRARRARNEKIIHPVRSHNGIKTIDYIQNRVNTKSDKMIYLGGYTDDKGKIYLMCDDCGSVFSKSTKVLRPSGHLTIQCDNCRKILSDIKEKEYRNQKIISKENAIKRAEEKEQAKEQAKNHTCLRCGKEFIGKANMKYCSRICARRQADSTSEHRRRMQAMSRVHDVISLEILYDRDNGKCWLCGGNTDWTDKTVRVDGAVIVHDNYPSIDHVIPLKHGGTHTWDNVRLAHFRCNSLRGASMVVEKQDGQMRFAI